MRYFIVKMIVRLKNKKERFFHLLILFFVYGFVKSIVYFAPLFLNNTLSNVHEFGRFEYSLNLGQTLSTVIALGLPYAYAYFVFKEKEADLDVIFHNIYLGIVVILVALGFLFPDIFESLSFNAVLIGVALSNQLFIATYYKLKGRNLLAIIIDCGIYIVLLIFTFLIFRKYVEYKLSLWSYCILGYTILMVVRFHLHNIGKFKSIQKYDWIRVLKYGFLIVITLFLTSLLTTSTRIYIEYFIDFNSVGIYSLFIRVASAIIIFHRVVVIILYRKIYGDKHANLDDYFATLIILALGAGFLLYITIPALAPYIIPTFSNAYLHSGNLFFWTILQAVCWTSVALLELIIYRENILYKYIPLLLSILVAMLLALFVYHHFLGISGSEIVKINVLAVLLIALCQILLIKSHSFYYRKTLRAHIILTLVCLFALFF
ncbi:polysaccharide biosynthesis protein [Arachidicoccus terrestris]|uniref:hypothetical protein n=1 Tax=Arachidicoccus terrestris TaxID=2875539 RepID=UPI001CC7251E|nr:hypothetical protein [Arachidicoccus terrestris]UAY55453.1 hypothetical protein K9M52_18960 [Arachidicoccus terrestris]